MDIIDFLASFPGRAFTLSEIARAAKINVASCHAVLNALEERGYLSRSAKQRGYTLGPALVAVGKVALGSQPLIERAQAAAAELARDVGAPVLLSAAIGDEILGIISIADALGRGPGLEVGERVPMVAPVGAPFVAWSSEEAIEAWIARHAPANDPGLPEEWRRALALTRSRGFQVTLRTTESPTVAALMAEMASGRAVADYKHEVTRVFSGMDRHLTQPETIEPEQLYDVVLIAAPLFNQNGEAAYSLCFGGFAAQLSGAMIQTYADRLVRTCLQIMREDRSPR